MSDEYVIRNNVRYRRAKKELIGVIVFTSIATPMFIARLAYGVPEYGSDTKEVLPFYLYNGILLFICFTALLRAISAAFDGWVDYLRPVFDNYADALDQNTRVSGDVAAPGYDVFDEEKAIESVTVPAVHVE